MSLNEEVELLRKIPLFANLEPSKLKLLAFTSDRIAFEGEAEVKIGTPTGALTVATLARNDFVGEIAILCDVPRTATVQAKTRLVTLRIAKDLFFRLIAEFPQMSVEIMRELASRLEHTTAQLREAIAAAEK